MEHYASVFQSVEHCSSKQAQLVLLRKAEEIFSGKIMKTLSYMNTCTPECRYKVVVISLIA